MFRAQLKKDVRRPLSLVRRFELSKDRVPGPGAVTDWKTRRHVTIRRVA